MEKWFTPIEPAPLPDYRKILVIAPHSDDEIFGCGGALKIFSNRATPMHIHVLTDGAGYEIKEKRQAIFEARKKESCAAAKKIGSGISIDFGGFEDRKLTQSSALLTHMKELINRHQPDLIFAPSPWEIHPDHISASRAVWVAWNMHKMVNNNDDDIDIMFYEIGSPLRANMLVDITSVWSEKEAAMQLYNTQLTNQNYDRHIAALNTFRTYTLPSVVRYAEAFYCLKARDLKKDNFEKDINSLLGQNGVGDDLMGVCVNLWIESVVSSATVHAEDLQRALIEAKSEIDRLLLVEQEKKIELEFLEKNNINLIGEVDNLKLIFDKNIQAIYNSSSWRITAPLRWLARLFK